MPNTKSAFIAIVGKPNVGKSSLMNAMLGEKVAIVTAKPQTTRTRITGVLTKGETQFVFLDTPGLHKPKNRLSEHMVKAVQDSVADVDAVALVVEPTGEPNREELQLIERIQALRLPSVLVINKIDTLENKAVLLERTAQFLALHKFDAVTSVSALEQDGIDGLLEQLQAFAKDAPHFFPDDSLTDQPERVIVAELIREKVLQMMSQEIPHGVVVTVERMHTRADKPLMDVDATLYCERARHKGMLIGKNGAMLKRIATAARQDIERFLDVKVNLQCWVKVQEDWRNKETFIKNFGLS